MGSIKGRGAYLRWPDVKMVVILLIQSKAALIAERIDPHESRCVELPCHAQVVGRFIHNKVRVFEFGCVLYCTVHHFELCDELALLAVAHGKNPVHACLLRARVRVIATVQMVIAVVRHPHPGTILRTVLHNDNNAVRAKVV